MRVWVLLTISLGGCLGCIQNVQESLVDGSWWRRLPRECGLDSLTVSRNSQWLPAGQSAALDTGWERRSLVDVKAREDPL